MEAANIEIAKVVIQGLGLVSIYFVYRQYRSANRWKKLEYSMDKKWSDKLNKARKALGDHNEEGLFNYEGKQISEEECESITIDQVAHELLKDYLGIYEEIACLYELNAVDKDYVYSMYSEEIIQTYEYFQPLIDKIRQSENDNEIYIGIEKMFKVFKKKKNRSLRNSKACRIKEKAIRLLK